MAWPGLLGIALALPQSNKAAVNGRGLPRGRGEARKEKKPIDFLGRPGSRGGKWLLLQFRTVPKLSSLWLLDLVVVEWSKIKETKLGLVG
uniref:Secreted protein n=1 Tax=Arundo donax TaxID=35708 RepID=A0A0A9FTN3_ARUDO